MLGINGRICTLFFRKQATSIYLVVDEPFYNFKIYNNFIPQSKELMVVHVYEFDKYLT